MCCVPSQLHTSGYCFFPSCIWNHLILLYDGHWSQCTTISAFALNFVVFWVYVFRDFNPAVYKKDEMLVQEKQNFDTCDFNDLKVVFALFLSPKYLLECTGCPLLLHTLSSSHMCFGSLVPVVCLCLYQKLKSPFTLCLTPAALNRSRPKQCRKSFPWSLW